MVPQLASALDGLASDPSAEILDGLRELERKTSLAFTLLKASVYSIVLQQEIDWGNNNNNDNNNNDNDNNNNDNDDDGYYGR